MCIDGIVLVSFNWIDLEPMLLVSSSAKSACLYRVICVCVCVSGVHISLVKRTRHGITASNRVSSLWRISSVYLNRHTLILHFKWAVSFSCSAKVANPTTLYNVLGLQLTHYRDQAEKCSTGLFPVHSLKWTSNGCGCSNVNASA